MLSLSKHGVGFFSSLLEEQTLPRVFPSESCANFKINVVVQTIRLRQNAVNQGLAIGFLS